MLLLRTTLLLLCYCSGERAIYSPLERPLVPPLLDDPRAPPSPPALFGAPEPPLSPELPPVLLPVPLMPPVLLELPVLPVLPVFPELPILPVLSLSRDSSSPIPAPDAPPRDVLDPPVKPVSAP